MVARTSGGREVASSILVAPTTQGGKIEKIYFLYLNDAEWKDFAKQKLTNQVNVKTIRRLFFKLKQRTGGTSQGVNAKKRHLAVPFSYLAYSTALVSRMTLTLMMPG